MKNSLCLDQDFFKNTTTETKRAIRGLARKVKNLIRLDVFKYLRDITPPGTTGLLFNIISLNPSQYLYIIFEQLQPWCLVNKMVRRPLTSNYRFNREIQIWVNLHRTSNAFKFVVKFMFKYYSCHVELQNNNLSLLLFKFKFENTLSSYNVRLRCTDS